MNDKSAPTCCTPESPVYTLFTPEEEQMYNVLINQLTKQGFSLKAAQELAYSRIVCEDITSEPEEK